MSFELPELVELDRLVGVLGEDVRVTLLASVEDRGQRYPVHGLCLGSTEPSAPVLALVGGVHGLERIGSEVVLAYLHTIAMRLSWDALLRRALGRVRLVFVPALNPTGLARSTRSNARGVDLMRNAPRHPESRASFLVGGQRFSSRLPWYAGEPERAMEPEARALVAFFEREVLASDVAISVDCHSGFGLVDRLWFPYARTRRPFPGLAEVVGLARLLDFTFPNHVYRLEPQAQAYTIAGDLWDHLYDLHAENGERGLFLPFTLEMGSWMWVKKNPLQLATAIGGFHPMVPHRLRRTLRRHLPLFDFLLHAVASGQAWVPRDRDERTRLSDEGFVRWYAR